MFLWLRPPANPLLMGDKLGRLPVHLAAKSGFSQAPRSFFESSGGQGHGDAQPLHASESGLRGAIAVRRCGGQNTAADGREGKALGRGQAPSHVAGAAGAAGASSGGRPGGAEDAAGQPGAGEGPEPFRADPVA